MMKMYFFNIYDSAPSEPWSFSPLPGTSSRSVQSRTGTTPTMWPDSQLVQSDVPDGPRSCWVWQGTEPEPCVASRASVFTSLGPRIPHHTS